MVSKLGNSHIASNPAFSRQKPSKKSGVNSYAQTVLSMGNSGAKPASVKERDTKPVDAGWLGSIGDRIKGACFWVGSTAVATKDMVFSIPSKTKTCVVDSTFKDGYLINRQWRGIQGSIVNDDGWLNWMGRTTKATAQYFPRSSKFIGDIVDRSLFRGRRSEQQLQIENLRERVGEDSSRFCETMGDWTKAYLPKWANEGPAVRSRDRATLDERTGKMVVNFASDHGIIERVVDYEHALLQGFDNAQKVLEDFTPPQVTKLIADTTANFVADDKAFQKGMRKQTFSSDTEKQIAVLREYEKNGKLPKGFPSLKGLDEGDLETALDESMHKYLDSYCNELFEVLLPEEEKSAPIWNVPLFNKINMLSSLKSKGYGAARNNILVPVLQYLIGELVVNQFTKKHDSNLMLMKIIGIDVTDIEMHGFGLGKTANVEKVAEKLMEAFVRDGATNEEITKILRDSKLKKINEQGPKAALRTEKEAYKRLKERLVHILRKNMWGVSTKKCKAKKTWFTPFKDRYKAFRHKIRELPVIGRVYRGIENTYHTIKFGLSYFVCLLLGKDKPPVGSWAKNTLSGSRLPETIADNAMETFHNPANRILFLRLLENLKNELVDRSKEIQEKEKSGVKGSSTTEDHPVKPVGRYDFSSSAKPIGKIADHYFPRILPRYVAKPIQKVTRFLEKYFGWKGVDIKTITGNAVANKLNADIESSTFDLIGKSLQMAVPSLDEGRIGMKLAAAFKKRGVDHPNLDQVISNKLRMFVERYISNIGEEIYLRELNQRGYNPENHCFEEVKKCGFEDLMSYEDYMNSAQALRNQGEALFLIALKEQGFIFQGQNFQEIKRNGFGTIRPEGSKSAYQNFMEAKGYKGSYYETYRREVLDKLLALSDNPKELMERILEGPSRK